jgi:hypothetical protein
MKHVSKMAMAAAGAFIGASTSWADTLPTHRIPAARLSQWLKAPFPVTLAV